MVATAQEARNWQEAWAQENNWGPRGQFTPWNPNPWWPTWQPWQNQAWASAPQQGPQWHPAAQSQWAQTPWHPAAQSQWAQTPWHPAAQWQPTGQWGQWQPLNQWQPSWPQWQSQWQQWGSPNQTAWGAWNLPQWQLRSQLPW